MNISIKQFDPGIGCSFVICDDDLRGRTFDNQDLRGRNFSHSDLRGADLSKAIVDFTTCFDDAIFDKNTKMPDIPMVCPEEGEFIGYKKAITERLSAGKKRVRYNVYSIVTLLIPADAKRSSATGRKCRCDKAKVLAIRNDGYPGNVERFDSAFSYHDNLFIYEVGKMVCVDNFDECRWHECSAGIHFFMTEGEALMYGLA